MSRANASIVPDRIGGGITVTFSTRNGDAPSYHYSGDAAAAILAGADPKYYPYDTGGGGVSIDVGDILEAGEAAPAVGDITEAAAEIAELGAL